MKDPLKIAVVVPAVAIIGLLISAPLASAKTTQTQTVDCGMGQSINQALSMGDFDKPLVVTVRGICIEAVTITRDGVTLQGDSLMGGEVKGPGNNVDVITVDGASRVAIDRLKVTHGRRGVFVRDALGVGISNTMVRQTASDGIRVLNGHARITDCTIEYAGGNGVWLIGSGLLFTNNKVRYNALAGIRAERGVSLNVSSNQVYDNGTHGIELTMSSQGQLANNTITGNLMTGVFLSKSTADLIEMTVTNNKAHGVQAEMAKLAISNNSKINSNDGYGVFAHLGTVLSIVGNEISGNKASGIELQSSSGQLTGATIQNNSWFGIHMWLASKLFVHGPNNTSVAGNGYGGVRCDDGESSVFDSTYLTGGTFVCTGF